ncbi:MAG: hypothetical protein GEU80_15105 [Dehalococcoidia bacterium]|nr:hypothetical protein [Dehalococcoidia bacterium]
MAGRPWAGRGHILAAPPSAPHQPGATPKGLNVRRLMLGSLLVVAFLAGCGDDDGIVTLDLTLIGGAHEGEYDATAQDGGCSYGLTGVDGFGLQYSRDGQEGFTSLQLIVPSTTDAAVGTSVFRTTATIGPFVEGNNYDINTLPDAEPIGSGTVTVDDRGDTATITIEGTTADGVGIDATVECHEVLRVR